MIIQITIRSNPFLRPSKDISFEIIVRTRDKEYRDFKIFPYNQFKSEYDIIMDYANKDLKELIDSEQWEEK